MSKRENFKRTIVFCLASLVVIAQTAVFAYIWYDYYRGLIFEPFWRKGNWVLIAIYALINVLFSRLYGGLKVGYLKRIDVFYSLTLATICTNVVTYFQITLINRWFLNPWPMVEMTLIQFVIILVWIWGSRYIYSRLYQARKLLVIYGDRDPGDLINKMNSRKDKYDISGKVHIRVGEKEIYRMMKDYDGVIIWDLPSNIRNRYLKHCFAHSIRCYLSPKISDVILMGSERIHLFDTPLLVAKNMGLSIEQRAAKRLLDIAVSGLGPTRDMSPLNTLNNCGSSSRCRLRSTLPTGVIRLSCLDANLAPFFSESTHMLRNLQILNGLPPSVSLSWK